jgi:hypothetical protein
MIRIVSAAAAALLLGGCYSMQGSERILGRDGTVTEAVPDGAIFRSDFDAAFRHRKTSPDVPQNMVKAMLSSGFTHIYSYCDNYFDLMGTNQRRSRIMRDSVAPISALITGVLALHNFEKNPGKKEDLLALLGLATGATASVLDIYDEHMLFGAENIGAVEKLTEAALTEHSSTVLAFKTVTFDAAVRHLLDNQSHCSPQHILSLTREAIREGNVVAHAGPNDAGAGAAGGGGGGGAGINATDEDSNKKVEVGIDNDTGGH